MPFWTCRGPPIRRWWPTWPPRRTLVDTAALHPREAVHAVGDAVLHATGGDLRDDATMVRLDWCGGLPRRRAGEFGADRSLASAVRHPGGA